MNDIYTWSSDLYPIVKKSFDERYNSRMNIIGSVAGIVKQDSLEYSSQNIGGYGALQKYTNNTLTYADTTGTFETKIKPDEHTLALPVSFKSIKNNSVEEARKIGIRLADSAYMTVLSAFYKFFSTARTTSCYDGVSVANSNHLVKKGGTTKFSNIMTAALSLDAICDVQEQANAFVTADGLPFLSNFDLLLVSPELEEKAKSTCGADARVCPQSNPETGLGANPAYGMRYMVIGGASTKFAATEWAVADSTLLREVFKLVYITEPTVLVSPRENPLVCDYIAYVDFAFGISDVRPIIFAKPAPASGESD